MVCSVAVCKKWATYFTIASFFLCGGIEYGIILPTAFDYLTIYFDGDQWMYGLCLAAYSISNLLVGPFLGWIYDKTGAVRIIVLIANLFEVGGNFMYFAATSAWMVVGSRFIVGVGAAAGAAIFGYLAHTSTKRQRTAYFSIFMMARQIGLILGPGMNFFLRYINFHLGPFEVNKYTSPGFVMTIVWAILELLFVVSFFDLPKVAEEYNNPANSKGPSPPILQKEASPPLISDDAREPLLPEKVDATLSSNKEETGSYPLPTASKAYGSIQNGTVSSSGTMVDSQPGSSPAKQTRNYDSSKPMNLRRILSEYVREEIIVLIAAFTITMFNQTALETLVVPLGESILGWHEMETSIFYMIAGAEIIISFIVLTFLSRKIGDRWLIVFGMLINLIAYGMYLGVIPKTSKGSPLALGIFIGGAVMVIFTLPFVFVAGNALYSKLLPARIQGFGQGIRRSMGSIASILGPLWAGSTYHINLYMTFGVVLFLLLIVLVLILLSFRSLKEHHHSKLTNQFEQNNVSK